jgi:peptidoglycan/xylan/chitin deacetylase (PgdA/CDA1 family)
VSTYADRLIEDGFAIFLFHGVIPEHRHALRNYGRKHLDRQRFELVLDELLARGAPVSMDDIVAARSGSKRLPARAFAVTFDDGFRNNLAVAAPILSARRVPATFYVTSRFVTEDARSWTDIIEQAVEAAPSCALELPWLGIAGHYGTLEERIGLLDEIRRVVKARRDLDPYAVAAEIARQLEASEMPADPQLDRKLTWAEVQSLAADPLFTVGGHGHTHRILSFLEPAELEEELRASIDALAHQIGRPLRHYSYPEGLAHCYSDAVIEALLRRGIVCAPTAEPGVNTPRDDLFRLRRIAVV